MRSISQNRRLLTSGLSAAGVAVLLTVAMAAMWWRDTGAATPVTAHQFSARWMGDGTILIGDGPSALLVDPYFSRLSREQVLRGTVAPDTARVDAALRRAGAKKLLAVLATQTTYDHALDIPIVGRLRRQD